jgi:hypothetical protein
MGERRNAERTVRCPIEGCGAEILARGIHLHVRQSKGGGHSPQGEVPAGVDFQDLETVGSREVTMDYPDTRPTEGVSRLCPFCERPFQGKQGVMIHLGRQAGTGPHPNDAKDRVDAENLLVARIDEDGNMVEVVEDPSTAVMPSTRRRRERDENEKETVDATKVRTYIESLREQGLKEEAEKAERMLLGQE